MVLFYSRRGALGFENENSITVYIDCLSKMFSTNLDLF